VSSASEESRPGQPNDVIREAYSHAVSSTSFWSGSGRTAFPAFCSYAYPAPAGFAKGRVETGEAYYDRDLGEFLLPYKAVRQPDDPEAMLMAFLNGTYRVAADLGGWTREVLECPVGEPLRPCPL
jgi:hypothetical protein